jgi:hypothetical protein
MVIKQEKSIKSARLSVRPKSESMKSSKMISYRFLPLSRLAYPRRDFPQNLLSSFSYDLDLHICCDDPHFPALATLVRLEMSTSFRFLATRAVHEYAEVIHLSSLVKYGCCLWPQNKNQLTIETNNLVTRARVESFYPDRNVTLMSSRVFVSQKRLRNPTSNPSSRLESLN